MSETESAPAAGAGERTLSAERLKTFTDGVVAIAMTLLILPLMESVNEASAASSTVLEWAHDEQAAIQSFVVSFFIIALFWLGHHRMFATVVRVDGGLQWLTITWMFTIVWMPVATAISGRLPVDAAQTTVYIGSMVAVSALLLVSRVHLIRHPALLADGVAPVMAGLVYAIVNPVLFVVALVLAVAVPAVGYWSLLLLVLARPIAALVRRLR